MGYIPKTTKQPIKVFMGLSILRLMIGAFIVLITSTLISEISSSSLVQIAGTIIAAVLYLVLSGKSPSNPNKIFLFGLLDYFNFLITPKKLYGAKTEEYARYLKREEQQNAKKKQRQARKKG